MIRAESLTRRYGPLTAVDNLSFIVQPGEVLGFLGPNGAGKTTTMRMIAGFVPPTSGRAEICGYSVEEQSLEARRRIGYLPEGAPSYGEMSVRDFLQFVARVRGLRGDRLKVRVDDVIGRLELAGVLDQRIETLSKGFRRRVGLAQAIVHDPPVLILDEPTDGLDPNQKHQVRQLIGTMARDKIIVISTHILEEVDAVCTRAIIIAAGRIVADKTPEQLARDSRYHNAVTLRVEKASLVRDMAAELRGLEQVASVDIVEATRTLTVFPKAGASVFADVSALATSRGWSLQQLTLENGRMDEVFRRITTEAATKGAA
ncbi:MAG: ABC transporter ATP-binding protein [Gammaproteobacteria bacterium]|nr:ABC transporter ATP-binding protein [Gammaproteobacteria bacterium]